MTFHGSPPGGRRRRPLSQEEINDTGQRLDKIVGDAARTEFNDSEFNAYSSAQIDRNMDIGGNVVDNRFDAFKPTAKRQDLSLDGSLGDNADNIRREVFAVKKVMSKAGAYDFKPGIEPTTVANERFTDAIKAFQAGNDLAVDGRIEPGGPSIHMLGRKAIGREDGKPSGYDAADFRQRTGRDGNRTLSGKPIFATPGGGDGAGTSRTQEANFVQPLPPLPSGSDGDKSPVVPPILPLPRLFPKSKIRIPPNWLKRIEKWARDIGPIFEPEVRKPIIGKTPAIILRFSDGRVYIWVDRRGKIFPSDQGPGAVIIEPIENKQQLKQIRKRIHPNYPNWDDRRSFQERAAAGLEGYVYGPVRDKNGKVSYTPLVDPSSRSFLGGAELLRVPIKNGIILTLAQIKAMGLSKWLVVDKVP